MKTLPRILWHLTAWVWLACVGLALLQLTDNIEITKQVASIGIRVAIFLLVVPASRYFGLRWLGRTLWAGLLGLTVLGIITFFAGGFILFYIPYKFFIDTEPWRTTLVHSSRGNLRYVQQANGDDKRDIVLVPITTWVNLPRPAAQFDVQHWTPINKDVIYLGPDSAKQTAADRRAYRFRFCTRQRVRLDSLDRRHRLPPQVLPAATQQGAGTLGCVLGKQVWCAPLRPAPEPINCSTTWAGAYKGFDGATDFTLRADRIYDSFFINLPYPLPRQPGKWPATLCIMWPWQSGNKEPATWRSAPHAALVTITRLDTVAHVIAGTFTGTLYRPYAKDRHKPKRPPYGQMESIQVSQGRFDLPYEPGLHYATP